MQAISIFSSWRWWPKGTFVIDSFSIPLVYWVPCVFGQSPLPCNSVPWLYRPGRALPVTLGGPIQGGWPNTITAWRDLMGLAPFCSISRQTSYVAVSSSLWYNLTSTSIGGLISLAFEYLIYPEGSVLLSHLVWPVTFDLSDEGDPASSNTTAAIALRVNAAYKPLKCGDSEGVIKSRSWPKTRHRVDVSSHSF